MLNTCSNILRLHRLFKVSIGLDDAFCPGAEGSRPGCTYGLGAQRSSDPGLSNKIKWNNIKHRTETTQHVGCLWWSEIVHASSFSCPWAEVEGNDCCFGNTVPHIGSNRPEPTALYQSRIHLKTSLVASERG